MAPRCPRCKGNDLRPTLARALARCRACAWEGIPREVPAPALRRIPLPATAAPARSRAARRSEEHEREQDR